MRRFKDSDNSASRFQQRIELFRPVYSQDSIGDTLTTWVSEGEVWADVVPMTGREREMHHARRSVQRVKVFLRYHPDLKEDWRIEYLNTAYEILSQEDMAEDRVIMKLIVVKLIN